MASGESILIGTDAGCDDHVRDGFVGPRAQAPIGAARIRPPFDDRAAPRRVPRRILVRAAIGVALLALGPVGLFYAHRRMSAWLHERGDYQIDFASIKLDPPVPGWYRGGGVAFLERFRVEAGYPVRIPLLTMDLSQLHKALSKDPWVAHVDRVERKYPDQFVIHLVYRRPVALVRVAYSDVQKVYVLDSEGIIVRGEDVDRERAAPLTPLTGLSSPVDPRPGLPWFVADAQKVPRPDPRVAHGAALAAFLGDHLSMLKSKAPFDRVEAINPTHDPDDGLWFRLTAETWVLWGSPVSTESPGELDAEEKWRILVQTAREYPGLSLPKGQFWQFVKTGLVIRRIPEP